LRKIRGKKSKSSFNQTFPQLEAKTETQRAYLNSLSVYDQTIVLGPAGTGKTYIAASFAALALKSGDISKIVITRPHVAVGKDLGHLPGTVLEKTVPWALPTLDVLEKWLGKGAVDTGLKNGKIEIAPLALMRGRSFEDSFIIVDEAQNISVAEVKMLVTRVGQGSKLVLNGDVQQSDLRGSNGLETLISLSEKYNVSAPVIEFSVDDIVRSDICKAWIVAFMSEGI